MADSQISSPPCKIDQTALLKIVLHSAKYIDSAVNGILIGRTSDDTDTSPPNSPRSSPSAVHVYDALPLSHSHVSLSPLFELFLPQVEAVLADGPQNLEIVGYYQCNENLDQVDLPLIAKKYGDKLEALYGRKKVIAVLDGPHLQDAIEKKDTKYPVVQMYLKSGPKGWMRVSPSTLGGGFDCPTVGVADLIEKYLQEGRHMRLVDYEDHTNDVSKDWRNSALLQ